MNIQKKINAGKTYIFLCLATVMSFLVSAQGNAQDKEWNFVVAPYAYVPVISGDVTINNNAGILSKEAGFVGLFAFEAYNPKWSIYGDLLLNASENGITLPISSREGTFKSSTTFVGFYGMRRVAKWFEIGLGVRLIFNDMNLKADAESSLPEINAEYNSTGVDPLIVYRFTFLNTDKWNIRMRGDVGGFGVYSIFVYMINPSAGYRISDLLEVNLSYRLLSFNEGNKEETGNEIDLQFSGPQFGLLFHF